MYSANALHDFSHFPGKIELFMIFSSLIACITSSFFLCPDKKYISSTESFKFENTSERQAIMYSYGPLSFLHRFLYLDLNIVPKSSHFNDFNVTATSHLQTPSNIYHFNLKTKTFYKNNDISYDSQVLRIFSDNSLITSTVSINLLFEGDISQFAYYSIDSTIGSEDIFKALISIKFSFFVISIFALYFYHSLINPIIKDIFSLNILNLIRILLFLNVITNFPFICLNFFVSKHIFTDLDLIVFPIYQALFISWLYSYYFLKTHYLSYKTYFPFILSTLVLAFLNFNIKESLISNLTKFDTNESADVSILYYIRACIYAFFFGHLVAHKVIQKYEKTPPIFYYLIFITFLLVTKDLFVIFNNIIENIFLFEAISIQFFNHITYLFVSMYLPTQEGFSPKPDNYVNEENDLGLEVM
ncbi:hypothetical protein TRFO_08407 [Tritrichomonas foetus]|uniref:Uncharacterized protein n=1 Tax=Tritrichomonas foetus TaxID=1144522 RepID=A0A1J4JJY9_9EUKA|nr:hypothetical protein TRFO_08407 [Tritrichomonas foetus]|eukprot:OHS99464.1 hypothetical protein TRFO_08407 [Tritrichomonas foetus]